MRRSHLGVGGAGDGGGGAWEVAARSASEWHGLAGGLKKRGVEASLRAALEERARQDAAAAARSSAAPPVVELARDAADRLGLRMREDDRAHARAAQEGADRVLVITALKIGHVGLLKGAATQADARERGVEVRAPAGDLAAAEHRARIGGEPVRARVRAHRREAAVLDDRVDDARVRARRARRRRRRATPRAGRAPRGPVSYTHLTLPAKA